MIDFVSIYKEQCDYVRKIAEDIKKHKCNLKIIQHASNYANIENEYDEYWRINFGEAYAYIELTTGGSPRHKKIWYCMDESIGCKGNTYSAILNDLNNISNEKLSKLRFAAKYKKYNNQKYKLKYDLYKI